MAIPPPTIPAWFWQTAWLATLRSPKNADYEGFCKALNYVNETLAKKMAGDGEGCTALFEVKVIGAESKAQAVTLSKSIITSSLTKAAIFRT